MWTRRSNRRTAQPASTPRSWGNVVVGTTAVVIRGAGAQIGEVVTIIKKCAVMVQVQFPDDAGEDPCMKRLESLLLLEDGLEVRRDRKGHLWVVRQETEENKKVDKTTEHTPSSKVAVAHLVEE
jgi:hypothetical protein